MIQSVITYVVDQRRVLGLNAYLTQSSLVSLVGLSLFFWINTLLLFHLNLIIYLAILTILIIIIINVE